VCIDTPDADVYLYEAKARGWTITQIWNTHWHSDHAGGNEAIQKHTGCTILGPQEVTKIAPLDTELTHGDTAKLGHYTADVIDVSGHTNGHIAFHIPEAGVAFVGDAVFALGCGRMFEGEPKQFWDSLSRHADPDNAALADYVAEIKDKRKRGQRTVPMGLRRELATNPFLRADDPALAAKWGGDAPHETFAALRAAKDNF